MNPLKVPIPLLLVGILVLGGATAWFVAGDPISQTKWDKIQKEMTKSQVIEIMGKPDSYDGNQIEYSRFLNVGWVEFAFDERDLLIWKNDESVFGSLRRRE